MLQWFQAQGWIGAGCWLAVALSTVLKGLAASPAMEREFVVRHWGKDQGLPEDRVVSILQSRDGYLWLGTHFGLVRFDGLHFTQFTRGTRSDMPDDHCTALAEDTLGNLWIGTPTGLLRWDGRSFLHLAQEEGMAAGYVGLLAATRDGSLWVRSGPFIQRFLPGKIRPEKAHSSELHTLDMIEADGGLWLSGRGLTKLDVETWEERGFDLEPNVELVSLVRPVPEPGQPVQILASRGSGDRYLASLVDGRWENVRPLSERNSVRPEWLVRDQSGAYWFPESTNGITRWREGALERMGIPWNRFEDFAICALADREGNLWIGTESSGLFCLTPKRIHTISTATGLVHENVLSVCPAKGGGIWASTGGGLSRIGSDFQSVTNWTRFGNQPLNRLKAVAQALDGTLWLGTSSGRLSFQDGRFTAQSFAAPTGAPVFDPQLLGFNKVRCFLPERDGSLWVAVPSGLHRLRDGHDQIFTEKDGLGADDVRALLQTRDGTIWAGTDRGGLTRINGDPPRPNKTFMRHDGLSRDTVWALAEDNAGVLWAGTDGGLNRIEGGRITVFDRRHGLPAEDVNCLLTDDFGNLWVGHERGLYRVSLKDLDDVAAGRVKRVTCVRFDGNDGLPVAETNGQTITPAACKTADGRLWFATPKGVAVVDPKTLRENSVPPPVVIERVVSDQTDVHGDNSGPQEASGRKRELRVRLAPGQGRFMEFHYTANTFIAAESARFRYRLEGHEDEWHDVGTRRLAQYIGLRPGDYRFRVVAANHHDTWNEMGATFDFTIAPFFWQTRWFWVLVTVVVLGSAGALITARERWVRRVETLKRQAAQAQLRARVAADLHDGLGSNLARLNLLAEQVEHRADLPEMASHQFREITTTARELARTVREIAWNANPADSSLNGLVAQIAQNTQDVLSTAGVACRLDLPVELPSIRLSAEQRSSLFFSAKEAVTNVIRHAHATTASVRVDITGGQLVIELQDNGVGFNSCAPASGSIHVDPRSSAFSAGVSSSLRGGNGLSNLRSRVESLGGRFTIQSQIGSGTRVRFEIPLAKLGETAG